MIELRNVTKEYGGRLPSLRGAPVRAVDDVTLHLRPGTALGLVGPNGAGKSTLIRLLLGYVRPTRGEIAISGEAPRRYVERSGIAYVSELVALPPTWTVHGALRTFAALNRLPEASAAVERIAVLLGVDTLAGRRISTLSKGNLQRVALAQALLAPRRVMILDEPTSGLDPEWIARLREIVAEWRQADPDRVLVIASHNLDEVERIADRVAVLDSGRIRDMVELRTSAAALPAYRLEIEAEGDVAALVRRVFADAVSDDGAPFSFRVRASTLEQLNAGLAELLSSGARLRVLEPEHTSLEDRVRKLPAGGGSR